MPIRPVALSTFLQGTNLELRFLETFPSARGDLDLLPVALSTIISGKDFVKDCVVRVSSCLEVISAPEYRWPFHKSCEKMGKPKTDNAETSAMLKPEK